jgi:hypothetical protein
MISAVGMTIDLSELRYIGRSVFSYYRRNAICCCVRYAYFVCLNLYGKSILGALDEHIVYIISKTYLHR